MNSQELQVKTAKEIAKEGILLLKEKKVRNHKLRNSAQIHTGNAERKEYQAYRNFLPSKIACMIYDLTGSENYE